MYVVMKRKPWIIGNGNRENDVIMKINAISAQCLLLILIDSNNDESGDCEMIVYWPSYNENTILMWREESYF